MMLFAIVFGLSMDYEVFLLSRIREEFDRTGDNSRAVVEGLAGTAPVITAAAAIMIAVFASFALGDVRAIKLIGFGLAAAVFVDAAVVRGVLVPASMELLGDRNWYLPAWLAWLPRVSPEQTVLAAPPAPNPPVLVGVSSGSAS
jgi:RND superfamily putative drug exporter